MKTLKRFVLVGAPASGKGTQSSFLSETYDLKPLSTGALLRAEVAAGSELGLEAKKYMDAAQFVPDDVVNGIVTQWLGSNRDCGCLLDGYPRTVAQAQTLDANLAKLGLAVDIVVYLNVLPELIEARMLRRKACPKCGETTRNGEEFCPKCGTAMLYELHVWILLSNAAQHVNYVAMHCSKVLLPSLLGGDGIICRRRRKTL